MTTPRPWVRSLALLPGGLLALLPAAKCPVCIAAYAGVLSSVGLGFFHDDRVLAPIISVFLTVGLITIAWSTRSHRRLGPLFFTVVGSAAVVTGRLIWNVPAVLYGGVALLVGASLWNLWLKRPRPERPLMQLHRMGSRRAPPGAYQRGGLGTLLRGSISEERKEGTSS